MAQTNLKSDNFCGYNQAASPFFWIMEPGQYENTYATGEVGVFATSNYVRPDVIQASSFLSGRDDILSRCNPPVPSLADTHQEPLRPQTLGFQVEKFSNMAGEGNQPMTLVPEYTQEKKSAVNLSSVDYNRWDFLPSDAQQIEHIIEMTAAQRGGLLTQQFAKLGWNAGTEACKMILDPARVGPAGDTEKARKARDYVQSVSGYPGKSWLTGLPKDVGALPQPYIQAPDPPIWKDGIGSETIAKVGMQQSGPQRQAVQNKDGINLGLLQKEIVPPANVLTNANRSPLVHNYVKNF